MILFEDRLGRIIELTNHDTNEYIVFMEAKEPVELDANDLQEIVGRLNQVLYDLRVKYQDFLRENEGIE